MSERKITDWFTVNGQHIPIFEGESKADAVNRAIAKNNEDKKTADIERNKKEAEKLNKDTSKNKVEKTEIAKLLESKNANSKNEKWFFKEISKAIKSKSLPEERAFYDIPDSFSEYLFDKYDPSDLYEYLTGKEQKQAYNTNMNVKSFMSEWDKKAIWRIAKAEAWDDLEVW